MQEPASALGASLGQVRQQALQNMQRQEAASSFAADMLGTPRGHAASPNDCAGSSRRRASAAPIQDNGNIVTWTPGSGGGGEISMPRTPRSVGKGQPRYFESAIEFSSPRSAPRERSSRRPASASGYAGTPSSLVNRESVAYYPGSRRIKRASTLETDIGQGLASSGLLQHRNLERTLRKPGDAAPPSARLPPHVPETPAAAPPSRSRAHGTVPPYGTEPPPAKPMADVANRPAAGVRIMRPIVPPPMAAAPPGATSYHPLLHRVV